jgi:hypothetical protein
MKQKWDAQSDDFPWILTNKLHQGNSACFRPAMLARDLLPVVLTQGWVGPCAPGCDAPLRSPLEEGYHHSQAGLRHRLLGQAAAGALITRGSRCFGLSEASSATLTRQSIDNDASGRYL